MKAEVSAGSGQLLELRVDRPVPAQTALRAAGFASATLHGRAVHLLSRDAAADLARLPGLLAEAGITVQSAALRPCPWRMFVQRITALEAADRKAP
jgi:hypothetical protein